MRLKVKGHWERKCKTHCLYISSWREDRFTSDQDQNDSRPIDTYCQNILLVETRHFFHICVSVRYLPDIPFVQSELKAIEFYI